MKYNRSWGWMAILLMFLFPTSFLAQTPLQLQRLTIEIWPEFDRPETLVIYRATLDSTVTLPADVTFELPGYIESMHAVAVEQNGGLVDVPDEAITIRYEDDSLFLTFTTPSPNIQFEYYDSMILTKEGERRELTVSLPAPYNTESAVLQVQQPAQAADFSMTPSPGNTFVGQDGLTYYNLELAGLAANDRLEISATYNRPTDELSIEQITLSAPPPANPAVTNPPASTAPAFNWGYVLIGAGVLLLAGVGGYWWWSQRQVDEVPVRRPGRPGQRRRQKKASGGDAAGGYCYRCGTALHADAQFCHKCGAERRG